jgi:superfamily II DNA or RNA helicase
MRYLVFVRPIEELFGNNLWGPHAHDTLRHHLFYTWEGKVYKNSDAMSSHLKSESYIHLRCELNVSKWRHAQAGVSRYLTMGTINPEGEDENEFSDAQSGKETSTALSIYSIEVGQVGTLCELKMCRFRMWSQLYQRKLLGLQFKAKTPTLEQILDPRFSMPSSTGTDDILPTSTLIAPSPSIVEENVDSFDATVDAIMAARFPTVVSQPSMSSFLAPIVHPASLSAVPSPSIVRQSIDLFDATGDAVMDTRSPTAISQSSMSNFSDPIVPSARPTYPSPDSTSASDRSGKFVSPDVSSTTNRPDNQKVIELDEFDSMLEDGMDDFLVKAMEEVDPISSTMVSFQEQLAITMGPPSFLPESVPDEAVTLLREVLKNPTADFRVLQQYQVYWLMMERQHHIVWVAPTGIGKTLPFVLAMLSWEESVVGVVVCPFSSLMNDMVKRMRAYGLSCESPSSGNIAPNSRVIVCGLNHLKYPAFKDHLSQLSIAGRLGAVIYDEAHGLISDSDYRPEFIHAQRFLMSLLNTTVTFLSGTIPPFSMAYIFKERMGLGVEEMKSMRTLRLPTHRMNLFYQISTIDVPNETVDATEFSGRTAMALARQLEEELEEDERGLVIFISRDWCRKLAEENGYPYIHGPSTQEEREKAFEDFHSGDSKVMCINKACIEGIDFPKIRFVIHADMPRSLLDWGQGSGRGGRDDEPCLCLVIDVVYRSSKVTMKMLEQEPETYSGEVSTKMMKTREKCIRYITSLFLDGHGVPCDELQHEGAIPCSVCVILGVLKSPDLKWARIRTIPTIILKGKTRVPLAPQALSDLRIRSDVQQAATSSRHHPYPRPVVKRSTVEAENFVRASRFLDSPSPNPLQPTSSAVNFSTKLVKAQNHIQYGWFDRVVMILRHIGNTQCLACWSLGQEDADAKHSTVTCKHRGWDYDCVRNGVRIKPFTWKKAYLFKGIPEGSCYKCGFPRYHTRFHHRPYDKVECIWDDVVFPIAWMVFNSEEKRTLLSAYLQDPGILEDGNYLRWLRSKSEMDSQYCRVTINLVLWFYMQFKSDSSPNM